VVDFPVDDGAITPRQASKRVTIHNPIGERVNCSTAEMANLEIGSVWRGNFYPVNPYTALRKYRLAVCGGKTSAVNLRQA
jgi:hypothetical protein